MNLHSPENMCIKFIYIVIQTELNIELCSALRFQGGPFAQKVPEERLNRNLSYNLTCFYVYVKFT